MKNSLYKIAGMVIAGTIIFQFITTYNLIFSKPPLIYNNVPFPVNKSVYEQGESVITTVDRCIDKDGVYTFTRDFENLDTGEIFVGPALTVNIKKGCNIAHSIEGTYVVPKVPGRYKINFVSQVDAGTRLFRIPSHTQEFEVR